MSRSLPIAPRSVSKSLASAGNRPQNTTGIAGLKPGSISLTGFRSSVMVSPTRVSATSLIAAVMKPISPGPSSSTCVHLRREEADALDVIGRVGAHHADALALLHHAVDDADQHDDAEIDVVPAIDQQRLQRRIAVALRRRQAGDDGFQHVGHAQAGLGRDHHGVGGVDADHVLDLLPYLLGLGRGQVDLVQHRHDFEIVVERLIDVGERLRLDALAGVDHQQRALAGRQRPRDFVGEVDMAGRVHQVEDVILAVLGAVVQPHRLRLDGDAALALDIHGIEHLLLARHFAIGQARPSSGSGGRPASICHGRYGRRWRSCGCWKWGRLSWGAG